MVVVIGWPRPALWLDDVLLHAWMRVFGTGDVAVRSLSIATAFAAVAVLGRSRGSLEARGGRRSA